MVISKNKVIFQSVEGNFRQFSKKIWTRFPRALPPGMRMKLEDKNSQSGTPSQHYYFLVSFQHQMIFQQNQCSSIFNLDSSQMKNLETFRFYCKQVDSCPLKCFLLLQLAKNAICIIFTKLLKNFLLAKLTQIYDIYHAYVFLE